MLNFPPERQVGERRQAATAGVGATARGGDPAAELRAVRREGQVRRRLGEVRLEDAAGGEQDRRDGGAAPSPVGRESPPRARKRRHFSSGTLSHVMMDLGYLFIQDPSFPD